MGSRANRYAEVKIGRWESHQILAIWQSRSEEVDGFFFVAFSQDKWEKRHEMPCDWIACAVHKFVVSTLTDSVIRMNEVRILLSNAWKKHISYAFIHAFTEFSIVDGVVSEDEQYDVI